MNISAGHFTGNKVGNCTLKVIYSEVTLLTDSHFCILTTNVFPAVLKCLHHHKLLLMHALYHLWSILEGR